MSLGARIQPGIAINLDYSHQHQIQLQVDVIPYPLYHHAIHHLLPQHYNTSYIFLINYRSSLIRANLYK